jgi:hypothetical protein
LQDDIHVICQHVGAKGRLPSKIGHQRCSKRVHAPKCN